MAIQINNITFSILKAYNDHELVEIHPDNVVLICLRSLDKNESAGEEILKWWSKKLVRYYGLCSDRMLKDLFAKLLNYLKTVLSKELEDDSEVIKCVVIFLEEWYIIIKWIEDKIEEFQLNAINLFIGEAVKNLDIIFIYAFKRMTQETIQVILQKSITLEDKVLNLLFDNSQLFLCDNNSSVGAITNLIEGQCTVLKYVSKLDFKCAVNSWKVVLKLSTDNTKYLKENLKTNSGWLLNIVASICDEIRKSVVVLYDYKSENPLPKFERILKVCSFYLKNLLKIAETFSHNYFYGSSEVLETIFLLLNVPVEYKNTKKQELIQQHLITGFLKLIQSLYKNSVFIEELFRYEDTCATDSTLAISSSPFCIVTMEIMKFLCSETDPKVIEVYLDNQILEKTFEKIPNCHDIFVDDKNHLEIVAVTTALFILRHRTSKSMGIFEKVLVQGVLQHDLALANISIDIWLTTSRFLNADDRYKYFKFWSQLNEDFPKFCTEPQTLFVETLMKTFYKLLPDNYKINTWNSYFAHPSETTRFILTLGIQNIHDEAKQQDYKNKVQNEVCRILETNYEDFVKEKYYRLIELLKLLITTKIDNKNIGPSLFKIWSILTKSMVEQNHTLLLTTLIKCCTENLQIFTTTQLQNIIFKIEQYLEECHDEQLSLSSVLKTFLNEAASKCELFKEHCDKSLKLIQKNRTTMTLKKPINDSICISKNFKNMMGNSIAVKRKHIAVVADDKPIESRHPKRTKLESKSEFVQNALRNANAFYHYFYNKIPCAADIEDIKKIIKIYNDVIGKS